PAAVLGHLDIQVPINHAWLHANGIRANFYDRSEMGAEIEHQTRAERLARTAGSGAAGHERNMMLRGVTHDSLHVFFVARQHHAERPDLKNAGVGAVQRPREIVEKDFASYDPLEIIQDMLALLFIHGVGHSSQRI